MSLKFLCPQRKCNVALLLMIFVGLACSQAPPIPSEVRGSFKDAQSLYDQGKKEEAEKLLVALKTKKPDDANAHLLLGRIYRETKHPDQAIEELEGAVNLEPQNANAYATLARLYQTKG